MLNINNTKELYQKNIIIPETSDKAAIFIETRCIDIKYVIFNHLYFLDGNFMLYIFHSIENETHIKNEISELLDINNIIFIKLESDIKTLYDYNSLMLSNFVYNKLNDDVKHILIFQHDSLMLKKWDSTFNDYDYIGAPWNFLEVGGNGGFSYRSIILINNTLQHLEYIKKIYNLDSYTNEDVIFSIAAYFLKFRFNNPTLALNSSLNNCFTPLILTQF